LTLLPAADLPGHPDYQVIIHDSAADRQALRSGKARLIPDTSPCYAELVVEDLFYQEDVLYGRFLRTMFRYRDFGDGSDTPPKVFGSWVRSSLKIFPPEDPAKLNASLAELADALRANVKIFAAALARSDTLSQHPK
jgi:hypothetical protein